MVRNHGSPDHSKMLIVLRVQSVAIWCFVATVTAQSPGSLSVKWGDLEWLGPLEQRSRSSVNSKLQVQFVVSNASMNWVYFSSGEYG